ncbi:MAG: hypothetical protein WA667_06040 [Candidatus Nitrosopolaris sp.]
MPIQKSKEIVTSNTLKQQFNLNEGWLATNYCTINVTKYVNKLEKIAVLKWHKLGNIRLFLKSKHTTTFHIKSGGPPYAIAFLYLLFFILRKYFYLQ